MQGTCGCVPEDRFVQTVWQHNGAPILGSTEGAIRGPNRASASDLCPFYGLTRSMREMCQGCPLGSSTALLRASSRVYGSLSRVQIRAAASVPCARRESHSCRSGSCERDFAMCSRHDLFGQKCHTCSSGTALSFQEALHSTPAAILQPVNHDSAILQRWKIKPSRSIRNSVVHPKQSCTPTQTLALQVL